MALVIEEEVDKEQGSMNEISLQKPEAVSRASPSLQPASSQPKQEKPRLEHCHDPHKKTSTTLIVHPRWSQQLLLGFRQLSCRLFCWARCHFQRQTTNKNLVQMRLYPWSYVVAAGSLICLSKTAFVEETSGTAWPEEASSEGDTSCKSPKTTNVGL